MKLGLFNGRHELPVENYIFFEAVDPTDLKGMRKQIAKAVKLDEPLDLYVTGLTVATAEVISFCFENLIPLTLWHYDRVENIYFPQVILSEQRVQYLKFDCGVDA